MTLPGTVKMLVYSKIIALAHAFLHGLFVLQKPCSFLQKIPTFKNRKANNL
jgi:hypothetical protein